MSMSIRSDAIDLLAHHKLSPESLLLRLQEESILVLRDEKKNVWSFVSRHRCRRYLMAKTEEMKSYIEIYVGH